MPTLLVEPPSRPLPPEPPRKRWTRAELAVLEGTGVLDQEHLELVDGDLINKMGKKRPHVNSLSLIYPCLIEVFGKQFINLNAPIDVAPEDNPTNEPEPDVIVLKQDLSNFRKANPRPRGPAPGRGSRGYHTQLRSDHEGGHVCAYRYHGVLGPRCVRKAADRTSESDRRKIYLHRRLGRTRKRRPTRRARCEIPGGLRVRLENPQFAPIRES
jgi:Putative restriction endonuclease